MSTLKCQEVKTKIPVRKGRITDSQWKQNRGSISFHQYFQQQAVKVPDPPFIVVTSPLRKILYRLNDCMNVCFVSKPFYKNIYKSILIGPMVLITLTVQYLCFYIFTVFIFLFIIVYTFISVCAVVLFDPRG